MFNRMDHVGVIVHDIDATLKTYCEQLGFKLLERVEITEQKVVAAFLDGGNSTIELISPTDAESGTARLWPTVAKAPIMSATRWMTSWRRWRNCAARACV